MNYNKPYVERINVDSNVLCEYGCSNIAHYKFRNGKLCCSAHYNSCPGKIKIFSNLDHTERTAKSLETRTKLGITKSSQVKGSKTRSTNGHYVKLAKTMQQHWQNSPWQNNNHCPILKYKNTELLYQGSYEYKFLEMLECKNSIEWIVENVARGPCIWYNDPISNNTKLYISDFIIGNTVYEIKSSWTWNRSGNDLNLEKKNKAKLIAVLNQGLKMTLVLDGRQINASIMD